MVHVLESQTPDLSPRPVHSVFTYPKFLLTILSIADTLSIVI